MEESCAKVGGTSFDRLVQQPAVGVRSRARIPRLEHLELSSDEIPANLRLFRLVSEVLHAIAGGAFHPMVGWHCQICPYRSRCWAW